MELGGSALGLMGFGVLALQIWGLGVGVWGLGSGVGVLGFGVLELGFGMERRVLALGWVWGLGGGALGFEGLALGWGSWHGAWGHGIGLGCWYWGVGIRWGWGVLVGGCCGSGGRRPMMSPILALRGFAAPCCGM